MSSNKTTTDKATPKQAEQYRYELFDHHGTVLETVYAETINEAANKFGMKIVESFFGFAVLSENGLRWSVRWQSDKSVREHDALEAVAIQMEAWMNFLEVRASDDQGLKKTREALANLAAIRAGK